MLKNIVESMILGYLNESIEDDLLESIFQEVSEETWEAIEEAILLELSPETLASYKKKAWNQRSKDLSNQYSDKRYRSQFPSRMNSRDHFQYTSLGKNIEKRQKRIDKRSKGIDLAVKKLKD